MKFIHIADVHLGAEPDAGKAYSKRRPEELWESFVRVISLCEREQIDLLLIAGDLFHRQPLLRELKEVNALFAKLTHTQVVLIAGNHDYIRSDSYYLTFQWNENVHPLLGKNTQYVVLAQLDTAVYGFSYERREIPEARYDGLQAQHKAEIEILLAHGGDEKHIPINRNMLRRSGFDYIAFGHIHKPQIVIKEMAAYAGALEPIDKNDTGRHGFIRGRDQKRRNTSIFCSICKTRVSASRIASRENNDCKNGTGSDHRNGAGTWRSKFIQVYFERIS